MSIWPSCKARKVLRALERIGWHFDHRASDGSHHVMVREGYPPIVWAFHDGVEIGPRMLARIAKQTGLKPSDL